MFGQRSLLLTSIVEVLMTAFVVAEKKQEVNRPPSITRQPLTAETPFKIGEVVRLPCVADGVPQPTYSWRKNGEPLATTDLESEIQQLANEGTLVINDPKSSHEGVYQCYASNVHGTAVAIKTLLKKAVLEPFPTVRDAPVHRPLVGQSLILNCQPPNSYPPASIYWGDNRNSSKLRPIDNTARISQDYSGNLYFANIAEGDSLPDAHARYLCVAYNQYLRIIVQGNDQRISAVAARGNLYFANVDLEDAQNGHAYICLVDNKELRSLVQGDDQKIEPRPIVGSPKYEPPRPMWTSPGLDIAIKGHTKKMKCIFSGYPTPRVSWIRLKDPMPSRADATSSFGQELVIHNVEFSDAGQYQCSASNQIGSEPQVKDFHLTVESPPFWRTKPPEDINTSDEEDAIFTCYVNGHPKPDIAWYIGGIPEADSPPNPRRTIGQGWLKYSNVSKADTQVIQCNASNAHGYIFANAYLNVFAEPPTFIESPQELKVAEESTAVLKCHVFGAPKPTLIWQKGHDLVDVQDLEDGGRFAVLDNGNLEITNIRKEDQDVYQCYVHNKFGSGSASGKLTVLERTVIVDRPESQVVLAGTQVSFNCNATTDPSALNDLKIEWKKDGEALDLDGKDNWSLLDGGRRLIIKQIEVDDSGHYTCNASNGLDSDTVTAVLTVKDRPNPPSDIRVSLCNTQFADVQWTPGSDSNERVSTYTVYYNSSHDETGKFHQAARVNSSGNRARIQLRPWTSYTFHVTAENAVGVSSRSEFSQDSCTTQQEKPYRNPLRVCTESRDPDTLVIVWEPMLRTEHNGEGFRYVISYKRNDISNAQEIIHEEHDWRQSELRVPHQETYKPYVIYVQAANNVGSAPGEPDRKLGFSGEDVPSAVPENFELVSESVNSTSASFRWTPIDENLSSVRGFFKGYQIRFWKVNDESKIRTEDVIINKWEPCWPYTETGSSRTDTGTRSSRTARSAPKFVESTVSTLWPFSNITAGVVVINGAKSGNLSQTVTFETPEGVPSIVPEIWVSERGSHHLHLWWTAPLEVNGILLGYELRYKKVPPAIDQWSMVYINDPQQTYKRVHDLDHNTTYLILIRAETRAGKGPEKAIEETTVSVAVPDTPKILKLDTGYDFVNVSWLTSSEQVARNPGREFIVRYRQNPQGEWKETLPEREHNWFNVTDLEFGKKYEFTVIALNRRNDRAPSESEYVIVGYAAETQVHHAASSMWLIILICLLILIVLVLLIIALVYRNRGGKYPVYEKERRHGNKGRLDEEPAFSEYIRTEDSTLKKSQGSLESSSKSEEEGSDSLGAYEDVDPTKFNDEGSFVDHAGYRRPLIAGETKPRADIKSPSALTTAELDPMVMQYDHKRAI